MEIKFQSKEETNHQEEEEFLKLKSLPIKKEPTEMDNFIINIQLK